MRMILKLSLKNLFRNKRRSLLTSLAVGVGLATMCFTDGLLEGMNVSMIKNTIGSLVGEAQVHNEKFINTQEVEHTIEDQVRIKSFLSNDKSIDAFTERVKSYGMLASPRNTRNIQMYGINTSRERKVNKTFKYMFKGEYKISKGGIILGKKLFEDLELKLGERVVFTTAEAFTGELTQVQLNVVGVISFGSDSMDEAIAFINIGELQQLLNLQDKIHEISIKFKDLKHAKDLKLSIWSDVSFSVNKMRGWYDIVPGIESMMDLKAQSSKFMYSILMILISFGVMNSLFMAIYERRYEFGVLRAIGTRDSQIVLIIIFESLFLSLISVFAGVLIFSLVSLPAVIYGLDYSGVEVNSVTFREPIFLVYDFNQFFLFPLMMIFFTVLISFYPALFTIKLSLNSSIKRSL